MTDAVTALGEHLRASGFDEAGVTDALGEVQLWKAKAMGAARPPLVGEPLATLVSLLHVRAPVERDAAAAALGPASLEGLVDAGLLAIDGEHVVARFQVSPWLGLIVTHDTFDAATVTADHVLGGSRAAETLARGTIRVRSERTLDLGSASGVQALLAALHSGHVVATDVNPRAVELVRLNALLNGFDNIEARAGSWFEPVEGERFDLIVANPPFVISPDNELLFRDGGAELDGLSQFVVQGVAGHLALGGLGHVLCNWAVRPGQERFEPVEAWVEGLECDTFVIGFGPEELVHYAARWNEHLALVDQAQYAAAVGRWLEDYRRHGIETIVFGLVLLRRRIAGAPWFRTVETGATPKGMGGDQLLRILDAIDSLAGEGNLLDERLLLVEGHELTHRMPFENGAYGAPVITLSLADGLGVDVRVDPPAMLVLETLDGERVLGAAISAVAAEQGLDARDLGEATLPTARRLVELGLLLRV